VNEHEVTDLLAACSRRGIRVWVAGGWAVDAVVGHQTRPHDDLDLAVDAAQLGEIFALLGDHGFSVTVDQLPSRAELTAGSGSRVDLHPVQFAADGSGVQAGLAESSCFRYAADAFSQGVIAGHPVPCLSVRQQLQFREGYELREVDHHDLELLRHSGSRAAPFGRRDQLT
jgi:lincosamide nucleotidyltransferase A/C/D/E